MTGITAESFSFKNKYTVRNKKAFQLVRKRKREMPAPPMYLIDPLELNFASTFLQRHAILIHKKVDQSKQLAAMAVAMGATLITEEKDLAIATDIVFCGTEQSVMPRLIHQALEQHIRIVSPLWIIHCYRRKSFQDPYLYPCHMNNKRKTLELQVQNDQDSNPFDIADQLEEEEEEFELFVNGGGAGISDCEMGRGDIIDKSPTPPVRPKKPTPTKDIADILNNPSVRELLEKKKKEQLARSSVHTKRLSLRSNKHKHNNPLYGAATTDQKASKHGALGVNNGINLWYGQKN